MWVVANLFHQLLVLVFRHQEIVFIPYLSTQLNMVFSSKWLAVEGEVVLVLFLLLLHP
jgi:hypothetical protein